MARCAVFALLSVSLIFFVASCKSAPAKATLPLTEESLTSVPPAQPETAPEAPQQPPTPGIPELEQIKKELSLKEQETQNMSEHFYKVGKAHFERNEYAEAEKNLKLAVQLNPNYEAALELLHRTQFILDKRFPAFETVKEDLSGRKRALIDQETKELERDYSAAMRLFENAEYERAKKMFEVCLERIRWFPYPIVLGEDYERDCNRMILDCDKRERDQTIKERQEMGEIARRMAEQEEAKIEEQRRLKIDILVQRITDLLYLGNYERAETLCKELLEEEPDNPKGKKLLYYAVEGRHSLTAMQTVKEVEENKQRMLEDLAESKVPYQDYFRFPDKEKWLEKINKRMPGITTEIEEEPLEIQHIRRVLDTRAVTLDFKNTPLSEVVSFLQEITGLNITIDPDPTKVDSQVTITLRLRDIILKNALQLIMDQTGYMYVFRENVIFITQKSPVTDKGIFEIYNVSDILAKIPQFVGPDLRVLGDPETLGGPRGAGTRISFGEEAEEEGERFGAPELIELIKAATGEDNWPEKEGFGTIEDHRGQLIVVNTREIHKKVQQILDNLRRNTGVFVVMEVRFIDVMSDFLEEIGIDYRGLGDGGSVLGTPFDMIRNPSGGTDAGITKRVPTPDRENLAGRLQNVFDGLPAGRLFGGRRLQPTLSSGLWLQSTWIEPFQVQAILHAREENLKVHNVSCAMITAHNRQRVFMSVLNQRAYIADYDTSGMQGFVPIEVGDPIVRNFQEGIVIDVRPVVSSDRKYITIDVRPSYSALTTPQLSTVVVNMGTFLASVINCTIEVPMVFLERAFTSVTIPDGGTALLGGLKEVTERKYTTSVPILDSIPLINWAFKRKGSVQERRSLIILITGRIVILREEEKIRFGTGPGG
jgi:general secretion pathway protein D